MAPGKLEQEDHLRDAAFNKAMHKGSSAAQPGFAAMLRKDKTAQKAAVEEYFKHWDQKAAATETEETREVHLNCTFTSIFLNHLAGKESRVCHLDTTVSYHSFNGEGYKANISSVTIISLQTCTSMAGANPSIFAVLHMVNHSNKPLPDMNIISHTRLAFKRE